MCHPNGIHCLNGFYCYQYTIATRLVPEQSVSIPKLQKSIGIYIQDKNAVGMAYQQQTMF